MSASRKNLDVLLDYFPAGSAESDRHILPRVFVYSEDYTQLLTPPPTSPRLMIGKKGTGKTALIHFYTNVLHSARLPALVVRPMDIDVSAFPDHGALGETARLALIALTRAIAQRLGSNLHGMLDSNGKALYEEAVSAGARDRDVVDKMAQLLPRLAKGVTNIDLSALARTTGKASIEQLTAAIRDNVSKSGSTFHLFLDDTDQVAAPDHPAHLQRIWAFLLAARELCQQVPQLRCVVSLREEVWRRLLRDAAGQRDQADHFLPLAKELFPTRSHIWGVVRRRLEAACEDLSLPKADPLGPFFEGEGADMPYTTDFRSWSDLIVIRSRERPRDAIQLINLLVTGAKERGESRITESDFHAKIREFSEGRVKLLRQELEDECPQITEVVRSLAELDYDQGSFKSSFESLRKAMNAMPSRFGITLRGRRLRPGDEGDAFLLWSFLYELGIINARVADSREKDGYRHVLPNEDPTLVSRSRWNDLQTIVWEVNPAYRDHLIKVQSDTAARTGLPSTPRRSRR